MILPGTGRWREATEGSGAGMRKCSVGVTRQTAPPTPSGPPPRSGEDIVIEPRRKKHSTLGASARTIGFARKLRKEMSLPEVLLWVQLKAKPGGYQFRKQYPLDPYVLDFVCIRARLAIEVDGEAHNRGDRPERDEFRDAFVLSRGFNTIRIPAVDVLKNMEGVVTFIVEACRERALPNPPRSRECLG
jgi:very-short-patch-repair endonuclease